MKIEDNKDHPFTAAPAYSPLVQKLHFMFGNLSRVDVRLNTANKKPYCNWFCRDNEFIVSAGRLPLYGANDFPMMYGIEGLGSCRQGIHVCHHRRRSG
jgi:hypothetical protein